ncbi:chemotaxis protein CheW [Natrinema salaciae]|uniref:Chemotaxis signal transduction protein n=1 Tax=Natrinema salaciae TaxID=1186196 RepID=A0A1H9FZK0_9EURY|nr:chemotaxis protein CheW [Natrinema salaciae]SEQ43284.1 Chemotaxis signal transduction protein [Natrinema salaciae]
MAPDLSEKLLGIDIDETDRSRDSGGGDGEEENLVQFVFVGVGEHRLALPVDAVSTITDPPTELTRVPRSPPAIDGLMDLRGEITAVINPYVHFSVTEERPGRERLLVLDRPSDQQSAAIRVDEVIGVETVPESDVLEGDDVEASEFSGDVLEHPLIVALVTQEREPRVEVGSVVADGTADDASGVSTGPEIGGTSGAGGSAALSSAGATDSRFGESVGDTFEIEPTDDADDAAEPDDGTDGDESPQEIVVEATALVDVDRLLSASGQS